MAPDGGAGDKDGKCSAEMHTDKVESGKGEKSTRRRKKKGKKGDNLAEPVDSREKKDGTSKNVEVMKEAGEIKPTKDSSLRKKEQKRKRKSIKKKKKDSIGALPTNRLASYGL